MRRKKHHRIHHRRKHHRRHVGALNLKSKDTGLKILSVAAGYFLADTLNTAVDNQWNKMNTTPATATTPATTAPIPQNTIAIGEIGIGGLLLMRKKTGGLNTGLKVIGGVLAGAGIKRLLKTQGIVKGFQSVPVIGRHRMTGFQSVPVIGGMPPQLSGRVPAQLQGYRVNGYIPNGSGIGAIDSSMFSGSGITTSSGSGYMG